MSVVKEVTPPVNSKSNSVELPPTQTKLSSAGFGTVFSHLPYDIQVMYHKSQAWVKEQRDYLKINSSLCLLAHASLVCAGHIPVLMKTNLFLCLSYDWVQRPDCIQGLEILCPVFNNWPSFHCPNPHWGMSHSDKGTPPKPEFSDWYVQTGREENHKPGK